MGPDGLGLARSGTISLLQQTRASGSSQSGFVQVAVLPTVLTVP